MRSLLVVLVMLFLAGCKPAQVTLMLDPGFYPSAVAHDPINPISVNDRPKRK